MKPFKTLLMGGVAPAAAFHGALVWYNAVVGGTNFIMTQEVYDTDSLHDPVTNADRVKTPAGSSLVRAITQVQGSGSSTPTPVIRKNGVDFAGGAQGLTQDNLCNAKTGPVAVTGGTDYFVSLKAGLATENTAGGIWLAVEELPPGTKYCRLSKSGTQALTAGVATAVTWQTDNHDPDNWHNNVSNTDEIVVPSGVTRIKVVCNLQSTSNVNTPYFVQITKNGAVVPGGAVIGSTFTGLMNLASAVLEVTAGDIIRIVAQSTAAQTIANGNFTWVTVYEVEDYDRVLLKKNATQAVTTGANAVTFGSGSTVYDTANAHDEGSNNTRVTVPPGKNWAKPSFSLVTGNIAGVSSAWVAKNGTHPVPGLPSFDVNVGGVDYLSGEGAWMPVVGGTDYFELFFGPGANHTMPADDRTWLCVEFK